MFKFKKHIIIGSLALCSVISVKAMQTTEKTNTTTFNFMRTSTQNTMLVPVSPTFITNIRNHTYVQTSNVLQPNLVSLRKFSILGKYFIKPDFWYHDSNGTLFMGIHGKDSIIDFNKKLSEYVSTNEKDAKLKEFHTQFGKFLASAYLDGLKDTSIIFRENLIPVTETCSAPMKHYFNLDKKYIYAYASMNTYMEKTKAVENVFINSLQEIMKSTSFEKDSDNFKKAIIFSAVGANKQLLKYKLLYDERLDVSGKAAVRSLQGIINAIVLCYGTKFCENAKPLAGVTVSRCKMLAGNPQDEIISGVQNEKMIIVFIPNDVIPEFVKNLAQSADKDYSNITGQHRFQIASPDELTRLVSHLNPDAWQNDIDVINEYKRYLEAEKSHRENAAYSSFTKFGISMVGNALKLVSKAAGAYATGGFSLELDTVNQSEQSTNRTTEREETFSFSNFEDAKREKEALKELIADDDEERKLQKQIDEINEIQMKDTGLMVRKSPFEEPKPDARPKAQLVSGYAKALRKALPKPEDVDELFAGFDHLVEANRIKGSIAKNKPRLVY